MKRILSVIIFLSFCVVFLNAGEMNIHLQDGTIESFEISEIDNITFEEGSTGTVTDIDGNVYQTIIIGDQEWMMENLKVTHYRNGDSIPHLTESADWTSTTSGAYCVYDNDPDNVATYGNLYNWYAAIDSCGLAPEGWHVPTDDEWQILVDYLGGDDIAGGKMKEAGFEHWDEPNEATNESGFTALPGGSRMGMMTAAFNGIGSAANFWSSSEYSTTNACSRLLNTSTEVNRPILGKKFGYSVRCVRSVK